MRGHVEESDEVKFERALRERAKHFAAMTLSGTYLDVTSAEVELRAAGVRYADALREARRPKRKRQVAP